MTVNDIPVIAFFKRLLDPFIIWGLLVLIAWAYDETFTGYYMVLMIITFFISSYIFEQTNIYRTWRNGKLLVRLNGCASNPALLAGFFCACKLPRYFAGNLIFLISVDNLLGYKTEYGKAFLLLLGSASQLRASITFTLAVTS